MEENFSLKAYSVLASAVITQVGLQGQVIYRDIPDIMLDASYDEYHMDIDDNGTEDFRFNKFSGSYTWWTTSGFTELRFANILLVNLFNSTGTFNENQIAGISLSTYFSYLNYWPYALPPGAMVDDGLQFQNGFVQHLASRIDPLPIGGGVMHAGYWWPSMEDHYLGVHFIDSDSNYHYGWIRCSVLDSAEVLIIKDFAYETEIDYPIVAGDTMSYVGIDQMENSIDASVYSFGKDVYIHAEGFQNTELIISDVNGKQIIKGILQNNTKSISMTNYPAGVYLVTLLNNERRFDKKVFIE